MVDEVTDIDQIAPAPEAAEMGWTKEEELEALGGLIRVVAEIIPDDEPPAGELNHTRLRRALSLESKARGWFFEYLITQGIKNFVDSANKDKPNFCDADPVKDGTYGDVVFNTNALGELIAYRKGSARPLQLAEYDGLVRIGSKLIIVETKMTQNIPKKFNLEGKVATLRAAFPDMEVSCLVVLQPEVQARTEMTEVVRRTGSGYTLLRRASAMRDQISKMAGRIHVIASEPMQPAPA